jgi:hypothetical protein
MAIRPIWIILMTLSQDPWLYLQECSFQIRSYLQVLGVRTQTCHFGGHNSSPAKDKKNEEEREAWIL